MGKYETLVQEVLNAADSSGGTGQMSRFVPLDLRDEAHFQCVMELFGGEEHVRREFPDLYRRAQNARTMCALRNTPEDDRIDRAVICDLSMTDEQALYSFGLSTIKDSVDEIYSIMTLYSGEEMVGRNFSFEFNRHRAELGCTSSPVSTPGQEICSVLHVTWTPAGSNALRSMVLKASAHEVVEDPVKTVVFEHPSNTNYTQLSPIPLNIKNPPKVVVRPSREGSKEHSYVNVCYDRDPENGESINYAYGSTRIGNQQQRIFLDIRGKFSLVDKCTFDKWSSVGIGLELGSGGSTVYQSYIDPKVNVTVNSEKNEVTFGFPTDWSAKIPSIALAGRELSYLDVLIEFKYIDNRPAKPENRFAFITASSAVLKNPPSSISNHFAQLPKVKLNWGCIEENALVRMANGSQQKICNIHKGDQVWTKECPAAKVIEVISGVDQELYAVRTADGKPLLLSAEHPICTADGIKPAMELTPADKLMLMDNTPADIDALYLVQGDFRVYSLKLEGGHTLLCNGYQTGDHDSQGELMRRETEAAPNPERLAEARKLARFFGCD